MNRIEPIKENTELDLHPVIKIIKPLDFIKTDIISIAESLIQ